jgi:hypothetical protein
MSDVGEPQVANEATDGEDERLSAAQIRRLSAGEEAKPGDSERPTMGIGEAASQLGLTVPQVRRLCKIWEATPGEGLDFAWSTPWAPRTDRNGHLLRGHRLPYVDAVQKMRAAQRVAGR